MNVEQAKQVLKDNGYVLTCLWHEEDLQWYAINNMSIRLSDDDIRDVKNLLINKYDASKGVSWDTIEAAIEKVRGI